MSACTPSLLSPSSHHLPPSRNDHLPPNLSHLHLDPFTQTFVLLQSADYARRSYPPTRRLTRELEKKFSDRHVVFIGQRRMMRKPTRVSRVKQQRPRSRTLKEVHEKILEDLVYPTVRFANASLSFAALPVLALRESLTLFSFSFFLPFLSLLPLVQEITGKRTRQNVDGSKIIKVYVAPSRSPLCALHAVVLMPLPFAFLSLASSTPRMPLPSSTSSIPSPPSTVV